MLFLLVVLCVTAVDIAWVWYFKAMAKHDELQAPIAAAVIALVTGLSVFITAQGLVYVLAGGIGAWLGTKIALRITR